MSNILKSKNALHVLSTNNFSGAENVAIGIIRNFGGTYCSPVGNIIKILNNSNIDFIGIKKLNYKELNKVIKCYQPTIIYAHDFKASLLIGYCFGKKYHVVSYIHQNPEWLDENNFKTFLYRNVLNNFYKVIVVSDNIGKRKVFENIGNDKLIIRYNKIDVKTVRRLSRVKINKKYDLCFVGRFTDIKQPEDFVNLINKLRTRLYGIRAVMVGEGEKMDLVKKMIKEFNLEKTIDLIGFDKNPYKYINSSKIIAITSKNEGLPMVLLESVCLKKCVLTYDFPTILNIFPSNPDIISGICSNLSEMIQKSIILLQDKNNYDKTVSYQSRNIGKMYLRSKEI